MFKLFRFLKPMWWKVIIAIILIAAMSYIQLLIPDYMVKISSEMVRFEMGLLTRADLTANIWWHGWQMILVTFAFVITAVLVPLVNTNIATNFGGNIRNGVYEHIQRISLHEYNKFGTAGLLTRITSDIRNIQMIVQMGMRIVIMSPTIVILAVIKIIPMNWKYIFLILAIVPVTFLFISLLFKKAMPLFLKIQDKIDAATLLLRQDLAGVRVVRAFNQEKRENRFYDEANKDLAQTVERVGHIMSFLDPALNIIGNITYLGVFFLSFYFINGQTASPQVLEGFGQSLGISQYVMQILISLMMLTFLFIMFPRSEASARRINEVFSVKSSINDPDQPKTPECGTCGLLEFKNVSFTFPEAEHPTLHDISFTVKPGTTTAIIGSTGSGKSTIINLIPRFYDVTAGKVLLDGQDVREYARKDLRNRIGFVPQQALLFSGTIRSNLAFGNPDADEAMMLEALRIAQAEHFVQQKEGGLDAEVAQNGKNFSGGQKQRLAIARALVKKPEIYIFDDSFSALDFKTDIRLRAALKGYTRNSAVLIVAQRISSIMDADEIIVLNDGVIAGRGKHADLFENCKIYKEIVVSQLDPDEVTKAELLQKQLLKEVVN